MRLFRDLWATAPRRTTVVLVLIALSAAGNATVAALAGPVLVNRSWSVFAALALTLGVVVVADVAVGLIMAGLSADWSADVRRRLCRVAFGQDLPTLETTPVGELLDRIDNDVYQVGGELRGNGVQLLKWTSVAVASMFTAFFVWWPAGLGMLVLCLLLGLTLRRPIERIGPLRVAEEEAWSDLAAVTEEAIHGQDDVRTSLARPYVLKLFARRSRQVLERGRRVWVASAKATTIAAAFTRGGVALLVVGGGLALATGRIDGARLTGVWLLVLAYAATVEHLTRIVPNLQNALGSWTRIMLLSQSPQEPTGGVVPREGDIRIQGLTFRYPVDKDGQRPPALRDVTLTFARGRSYAVIGRTGSGKSTLAKVLTRSVDVPRGTVYLGETDIVDLDLAELRRWIGVVSQRTEILAGTLAENVALFDPELVTAAEQAIKELGLADWVADLPDGLSTRLGDGGYVLSAGQEQLVAFARLLVRDPKVVILDEATARMDPVTEARVHQATERLLRGRIGIIIAHRLSSVRACDEVIVLADGQVVEAGPLADSQRFARLLASAETAAAPGNHAPVNGAKLAVPPKADPPPLPDSVPARTLREILRLAVNDARYGLAALAIFMVMVLAGLDGSLLPWLWSRFVDAAASPFWPAVGICVALVVFVPLPYYTAKMFPEWWVRQILRINLRLVYGQTGPRRVSKHTPAEVVAQAGDTDRVIFLADNAMDQFVCIYSMVAMTVVSRSFVPAAFFAATMVASGLVASLFAQRLERSARTTVAARAAFATALASSLSSARTIKLAGAAAPVLAHLARLDEDRSVRQRREISTQVIARSVPGVSAGLLPIGAWALYLSGRLTAAAVLVAVSTLGSARWFAWTTASLVSALPSARVWTRRTVDMSGVSNYTADVPGVDLSAGTAPAPVPTPRKLLRRLELSRFTAVHEDGTLGARDVDLTIEKGQLVLVIGPVASGKSSLLRALAGIVHHTGALRWNGEPVDEPEVFLRPSQVGYVAQLPKVLSGTIDDNIRLGHEVDARSAITTAQLDHDLAGSGAGLGLVIGHKGTRLSGGQLQRLALARALAARTELLIADDVSSALDVTTELQLWRALRARQVTVVGSTSKRAALAQADWVVVLDSGRVAAQGRWEELDERFGHLAG